MKQVTAHSLMLRGSKTASQDYMRSVFLFPSGVVFYRHLRNPSQLLQAQPLTEDCLLHTRLDQQEAYLYGTVKPESGLCFCGCLTPAAQISPVTAGCCWIRLLQTSWCCSENSIKVLSVTTMFSGAFLFLRYLFDDDSLCFGEQ